MNGINDTRSGSLIFTGTSNVELPVTNKASYPPAFREKSRLEYYASLFNSVEINSSFKKIPMPKTVARWAASVPDGFRFTFKLWNGITHNKDLVFQAEDVKNFLTVISASGSRKGCLLVQFPGKLSITALGQVDQLLMHIRNSNPGQEWKVALEFRNQSWYHTDVYELLNGYQAAIVYHDMPGSVSTGVEHLGAFIYVRFHGTEKGYRGTYPDALLKEYAERMNTWNQQGREVYVYFNNTLGDAVKNLMTLNSMLIPGRVHSG